MSVKLPLKIAKVLKEMSNGVIVGASTAKHAVIEELIAEGVLERRGRVQKKVFLVNQKGLDLFLKNKFGIHHLPTYISRMEADNSERNQLVAAASDSKLKYQRSFKGFLINAYEPISCLYQGEEQTLEFRDGIYQFMANYEAFVPNPTITIVGIENPENFRFIHRQRYLFNDYRALFVSRYPQSQNKDLIRWLQSIPNAYLHFGDFDFAGINIYRQEYQKHLGDRASFFLPSGLDKLIERHGNRKLYNQQNLNKKAILENEESLERLITILHKHKKGLEQEILIALDTST
ncbi:MAG: hypothetical protein JJU23_08685 [Cyclobacteriaceae bacterium]|nr:hypothetical protein [Cyclobacteriaceae bacterium]